MIDESILDEVIPVPDADVKMAEMKENLEKMALQSVNGGLEPCFTGLSVSAYRSTSSC